MPSPFLAHARFFSLSPFSWAHPFFGCVTQRFDNEYVHFVLITRDRLCEYRSRYSNKHANEEEKSCYRNSSTQLRLAYSMYDSFGRTMLSLLCFSAFFYDSCASVFLYLCARQTRIIMMMMTMNEMNKEPFSSLFLFHTLFTHSHSFESLVRLT